MIKQILSEEFSRMQKLAGIITESAFNKDGEPMMTHNQYRDYNEPLEDEEFDNSNDNFNMSREFIDEMKKNNIFVETFDGNEYFIRCINDGSSEFMIYFINDEEIEIYGPNDGNKNNFNYQDAIDYTLKNKNLFLTYNQSTKERDNEINIDAQDRKNNRAESQLDEAPGEDLELKSAAKQIFSVLKKYGLKPEYDVDGKKFTSKDPHQSGYGARVHINNGMMTVAVYDRGIWQTIQSKQKTNELDMGPQSYPTDEERQLIGQTASKIYNDIVSTLGKDKFELRSNTKPNEYGDYIIQIRKK